MSRTLVTAAIWSATCVGLIVGGLIATILVLMPTTLGPTELVEAGVEPWNMAIWAACGFSALVVMSIAGLAAWHSTRFKLLGLLLLLAQLGGVIWAAASVYAEYF